MLSFVRRECTGAIRRDKSDLHFHVFGILKQSTLLYIKSLMFQNVVHWKKCQILFTGPDRCLQQQGLKKQQMNESAYLTNHRQSLILQKLLPPE